MGRYLLGGTSISNCTGMRDHGFAHPLQPCEGRGRVYIKPAVLPPVGGEMTGSSCPAPDACRLGSSTTWLPGLPRQALTRGAASRSVS